MTVTRLITFAIAVFAAAHAFAASPTTRPNIVYILADDLGYGDVQCYNPQRGKIPTPHIDALAERGVRFTDAHASSSVCTPTRYNILTGRYAWRTRLQRGVLQGDSPPLIARERLTVAELLRKNGYTTAAIGKWHLGLASIDEKRWSDPLTDGPLQHGFEKLFGISASLDMPPFAYIAGDRFPELPTTRKTWLRTGPAAASFEAVDVLPDLVKKSVEFIAQHAPTTPHAGAERSEARAQRRPGFTPTAPDAPPHTPPFFLYLALTSPHTPIVPGKSWIGRSGLGPYGDFVMQTDAAVGAVCDALRDAQLEHDTLVILTSDNGPSPAADIKHLEAQGHFPSANFRGHKADIWEGGHRIPFILRWPAAVAKPGRVDDRIICLGDLMATCAELLGVTLPDNAGEDSFSFLSALRGETADDIADDARKKPPRGAVVHHSINGNFAIRHGRWKLALCAGSGGWSAPREPQAAKLNLPPAQLYDLSRDPAETTNLAADNPKVVEHFRALLQRYIDDGRSTPGPRQENDVAINLRKHAAPKP